MKLSPLEKRPFRIKNPKKKFFCALCGSERFMKYRKNLSSFQYGQIVVLVLVLLVTLFPLMGSRALYLAAVVWPAYEAINKILYRAEVPCPYCGFDATWYRRDVKVARKKVEEFWQKQLPASRQEKEPEQTLPQ